MSNKDNAKLIADRDDPTTVIAVVIAVIITVIAHRIGVI